MAGLRPAPIEDALSREWLQAATEHRLLIQRCRECERFQFYPRGSCVYCHAADPEWHEACGNGRLHTFSVIRYTPNEEFAADCPYVFAIVELEEGVRMTSRVVDVDHDEVRCEMPLNVTFRQQDEITLPFFTAPSERED